MPTGGSDQTSAQPVVTALGRHVSQVAPAAGRAYPGGGGLLVRGSEASLAIDAPLGVPTPEVDGFLLSHFHEDHVVGVGRSGVATRIHDADLDAVRSWDGFERASGYADVGWREIVTEQFDWAPIPTATALDLDPIDLGGVTIRPVHLPGHTPGHCGFLVEPDGVLYLGDIDLTGFGPYYGDACSSLADFRRSLHVARDIDAATYVTFHQKGPYGRSEFLTAIDGYIDTLDRRSERLAALLATGAHDDVESLVGHGVVYRPASMPDWARVAERRMIAAHLDELRTSGQA